MADKRIRALNTAFITPLDATLAIDHPSFSEAEKRTVQQFISLLTSNISGLQFYSGDTNPDPATGDNKDIYIKVTLSTIAFYQKISGLWLLLASFSSSPAPETNATTSFLSLSDLNTAYPSATVGQDIICELITDEGNPAPQRYTKGSLGWYSITLSPVS